MENKSNGTVLLRITVEKMEEKKEEKVVRKGEIKDTRERREKPRQNKRKPFEVFLCS